MSSDKLSRLDFLRLAGLLPLSLASRSVVQTLGDANNQLPNILILVFDALTAQNMSLYGYPRLTTPYFEKFARQATVYHRHYSAGSFTSPGTASLLTGVYPWTHRAINLGGVTIPQFSALNLFNLLASQYNSFAYTHNLLTYFLLDQFHASINQLLRVSELCLYNTSPVQVLGKKDFRIAYEAEALMLRGHDPFPASAFLSNFFSMLQSINNDIVEKQYSGQFPYGLPEVVEPLQAKGAMKFTLEEMFDWLTNQVAAQPKPFLGYVHAFPPHRPYRARREFVGMFANGWKPIHKPQHPLSDRLSDEILDIYRQQYDEFILYVDAEFGRFLQALENNGALDNLILVITSDHGEMFERGITEHNSPTLYEPIVHIPLLIHTPGQNQRQDVHVPTSGIDLLPTLLQWIGMPVPAELEGKILPGSGIADIDANDRSLFVVEAKSNFKTQPLRKATFAIYRGQYKLIWYKGYPGYDNHYEMYNLQEDAEELNDIYSANDPVAVSMKQELESRLQEADKPYLSTQPLRGDV